MDVKGLQSFQSWTARQIWRSLRTGLAWDVWQHCGKVDVEAFEKFPSPEGTSQLAPCVASAMHVETAFCEWNQDHKKPRDTARSWCLLVRVKGNKPERHDVFGFDFDTPEKKQSMITEKREDKVTLQSTTSQRNCHPSWRGRTVTTNSTGGKGSPHHFQGSQAPSPPTHNQPMNQPTTHPPNPPTEHKKARATTTSPTTSGSQGNVHHHH